MTSPATTWADIEESWETDEPATPARFRGITLAELRQRPHPTWLIEDYLQADTVAVLEGRDNVFKTFLALDFAHRVAFDVLWRGRRVAGGRVLYLLGEGSSGLARRVDAWQIRQFGHPVDDLGERLRFVVEEMPQLWKGDASAVIAANPGPFALIVVDTLARSLVGGNENSQQDMGLLIDGCEQLRRAYPGTVVLVLHHLNQTGGTRGSTTLPGAVHTKLRMARVPNSQSLVELVCEKQREAEPPAAVQLTATRVELGIIDEHGRPVTSLVLEAPDEDVESETPKPPRLTALQLKALQALAREPLGYAAWRTATGQGDSTLYRGSHVLIQLGYVDHRPDGPYAVTDRGRSALAELADQPPLESSLP